MSDPPALPPNRTPCPCSPRVPACCRRPLPPAASRPWPADKPLPEPIEIGQWRREDPTQPAFRRAGPPYVFIRRQDGVAGMWDLPAFEITQHDGEGMQRTPATVCNARYILDRWPEVVAERPTREAAERKAESLRRMVDEVRAAKMGLTQKMLASVVAVRGAGGGSVVLFDRNDGPVMAMSQDAWEALCAPRPSPTSPPTPTRCKICQGDHATPDLAGMAAEIDRAGMGQGDVLAALTDLHTPRVEPVDWNAILRRAAAPPLRDVDGALDVLAARARQGREAPGETLGTVLTVSSGALAVGVSGEALTERIQAQEAEQPPTSAPTRAPGGSPRQARGVRALPTVLALVMALSGGLGLPLVVPTAERPPPPRPRRR